MLISLILFSDIKSDTESYNFCSFKKTIHISMARFFYLHDRISSALRVINDSGFDSGDCLGYCFFAAKFHNLSEQLLWGI